MSSLCGYRLSIWLLMAPASLALVGSCTGSTTTNATTSPLPNRTVPAVVGMTFSEARQVFNDAGLIPFVSEQVYAQRKPGTVLAQNVKAGSQLHAGGEVGLAVVVRSPVPQLTGGSLTDAKRKLRSVALRASVQEVPSSEPSGTVISQGTAAGKRVPGGTKVKVVVAR